VPPGDHPRGHGVGMLLVAVAGLPDAAPNSTPTAGHDVRGGEETGGLAKTTSSPAV